MPSTSSTPAISATRPAVKLLAAEKPVIGSDPNVNDVEAIGSGACSALTPSTPSTATSTHATQC